MLHAQGMDMEGAADDALALMKNPSAQAPCTCSEAEFLTKSSLPHVVTPQATHKSRVEVNHDLKENVRCFSQQQMDQSPSSPFVSWLVVSSKFCLRIYARC